MIHLASSLPGWVDKRAATNDPVKSLFARASIEAPAPGKPGTPRVLVLADHYLPGYRAGGPIKSLRNLATTLGGEGGAYDIGIVTRDRDLGQRTPYNGIAYDRWVESDGARIRYIPAGARGVLQVAAVLRHSSCDLIYLNSLFSPKFTIWPLVLRRLGLLGRTAVVIAPRGELSPGALRLKQTKKRAYLRAARSLGLYGGVIWQASSPEEDDHVQREFGAAADVRIGPNIPVHVVAGERSPKREGELNVLFLSRIARTKNLDFALRLLRSLDVDARFTIIGPVEDRRYWKECQELIDALPDSITVDYRGPVLPDRTMELYRTHDLLLFPTCGENYGWVIAEALAAGCPVLTSDQTPWRDLQQHGVGWDLPLAGDQAFIEALRAVHAMSPDHHRQMADRARTWVRNATGVGSAIGAQRAIFDEAVGRTHRQAGDEADEGMSYPPSRLRKVSRYIRLYGPRRTWAKVQATRHMDRRVYAPSRAVASSGYVAFIGCGKFAFSTLAYYLVRDFGQVVRRTMDRLPDHAASLAQAYGGIPVEDVEDVLADERVKLVFIASNHASHADYAIRCLRAGKSVHVEKPPAVDRVQLEKLCDAARESMGSIMLGFNRPHSRLGARALAALAGESGPSAQGWFVAGHRIPPDHWYHDSGEGGRVLGNLCHWIDFSLRAVPESGRLPIVITPASGAAADVVQVSYTFGDGSMTTLTLSSTSEPFEGVRERLTAQRGNILVGLNDFEVLRIDRNEERKRIRSLFRDHGHRATVRRSVEAAAGRLAGDDPDYIWRTGMLSIWTHEAVTSGRTLLIDSWSGAPRRLVADAVPLQNLSDIAVA